MKMAIRKPTKYSTMAKYTIIKLKNLTPLHIGTGKENYDFSADDLQSDTISSALAAMLAKEGKGSDIKDFMNSFSVSSAFPFFKNHYFLPKIQGKLNVKVEGSRDEENRKELKNIRYIELEAWQKLMATKENITINKNQLHKKYLLSDCMDFNMPAKSQVMQRVTIPRGDGQDAQPFYFDWTYFSDQGGLYFFVDATPEVTDTIVRLTVLLGEFGLGTDRNIGGGKFEVEKDTIEINEISDTNASLLLSLYVPEKEELQKLNLTQSKYQLIQRGGFMAGSTEEDFRHLRKKSVYMLGVGSVFPTTETLKGKVVDLTPEWNDKRMHPVYRSGKPFCLPVTI
jgi:CRISPR type III-A-associated RAMP protein Csm4